MIIGRVVLGVVLAGLMGGYLLLREPTPPSSLIAFRAEPIPPDRTERAGVDVAPNHDGVDLASVGARWYMNYTYEPDPKLSAEFVPLVCGYPGRAQFSPAKLASTRDFLI